MNSIYVLYEWHSYATKLMIFFLYDFDSTIPHEFLIILLILFLYRNINGITSTMLHWYCIRHNMIVMSCSIIFSQVIKLFQINIRRTQTKNYRQVLFRKISKRKICLWELDISLFLRTWHLMRQKNSLVSISYKHHPFSHMDIPQKCISYFGNQIYRLTSLVYEYNIMIQTLMIIGRVTTKKHSIRSLFIQNWVRGSIYQVTSHDNTFSPKINR